MSYTLSSNMSLPIPGVGTEPGPDYATDVNNSLTLIDSHDHSLGSGVQITPLGLNINDDLSMESNFLTNIAGLTLVAQNSTPANATIYRSGDDLFYVDGIGNNVQITQNGGVAGSPGSISNLTSPASASYVAGSKTFIWQSDTNIAANMDFGAAILRNLSPNSTFGLTLQPPAALSSDYSITLPTLPVATSFLAISNGGIISTPVTTAAFLPNNAGEEGQFYRQSNTGAPTWNNIAANTQTWNGNSSPTILTNVDDVAYVSTSPGGGFTVGLPDATLNIGKVFTIIRTNSTTSDTVTVDPVTVGQTIGGYSSVPLSSLNETWVLVSDGTNYQIMSHTSNDSGSYTPTITGVGSVSGKVYRWDRKGRYMNVIGTHINGTVAASLWSITLPLGLTIDPSWSPSNSTTANPGDVCGQIIQSQTTNLRYALMNTATSTSLVYSGSGQPGANALIPQNGNAGSTSSANVSLNFRIPILNWFD